jgi:hypothetical protein
LTFPQIDSTSLRTGGPARAEHWLRQVERSELAVPGPATLIGMGELAAEEARALTSVDWAKASIHAYELSARLFPESKQSAVDKAMLLRSWFIARLGSIKGDQLLDAETVADSFVADLPYSLEDALDKIKHWKRKDLPLASRLPIEDVRKLRNVKNRLAAIRLLVDSGNVAPNSPLLKWLVVQPDLP